MKETVIERMERIDAPRRIADFNVKMQMPYAFKKKYAAIRAREFAAECDRRGLNYHVSVGGLDSITLLLFLRSLGIDAPGISVSFLEDASIQKVHRALGVEGLKPLVKETRGDGKPVYWTKDAVIRAFGFPVLSKEIAGKIELLQHPTEKNKTVRHAIITGETGKYGGNRKESLMRMSQRWLDIFGGADMEGAALGYKAAPFLVSAKCCYYLKERPCDLWAKMHDSVPYLGLMASEGGRRAKSLKINGCNYFGESTIRSAPFATAKGIIAIVAAGAGAYFHELLAPVIVLGLVMLADYISGLARAWIGKTLCSRAGIVGIIKKLAYLLAVAVAVVVDWVIQTAAAEAGIELESFYLFGLLVTIWLVLNECISILENFAVIGVPLPAFLMRIVEKLKQTTEEKGEEVVENVKGEQGGQRD